MRDLQTLLNASAERHHNHLCPRQVLGVRMGLYAAELFDLDLPQNDKRLSGTFDGFPVSKTNFDDVIPGSEIKEIKGRHIFHASLNRHDVADQSS